MNAPSSRRTLLLAAAALTQSALAEGLRPPTVGAYGLGATGARTPFVDDASAVVHNPANLTGLTQWDAAAEPMAVYHGADFRSAYGTLRESHSWKFLPAFYAGGPVSDSVAVGFAVTAPYGLSVDWDPKGPIRYFVPHHNELDSLNLNPTVAVKLGPKLSLAAGVDAMWSKLDLRQYYPWAQAYQNPALPDGLLTARGDGVGYSGNGALTYEISDRHRVAFTARAPLSVQYGGHFSADHVPGVPGGVVRTTLDTAIHFPAVLSVGYGWRVTPSVELAVQAEWVGFSSFDRLALNTPLSLPGVSPTTPENWRDNITAGASVNWRFADHWSLRGSYEYFQTPTRDATFSPTVPDSNQHAVTGGLEYRVGRHHLGLAYAYVFYDKRTITTDLVPALNGTLSVAVHVISASYGLSF